MTEEELNAIVESKLADRLAARLEADRARVRAEVVMEIRREADRAWYARINARAPIEDRYGGLTPEQYAARDKAMRERAAEDVRQMAAAEARGRARVAEMSRQRGPRASIGPGHEGFEVKRGGV